MKINGREITGPNRVTLVLEREEEEDIVLIAEAIEDMGEFDKYMDPPKAPARLVRGGNTEYNYDDPGYQDQLRNYNLKKMAWMLIKSLEPSNIEWVNVNLENPSTWLSYITEMQSAGFGSIEINRVGQAVMQANALDENKLEAARLSFLRGQADLPKSTNGPSTPPQTS